MLLEPILHKQATSRFIIRMIHRINFAVVNNIKKIGAIFCHVWNKKAVIFDRFDTNGAPQKCKGASLFFNNNARVIHMANELIFSAIKPPDKIIKDPILCTKKYIIPIFFPVHL